MQVAADETLFRFQPEVAGVDAAIERIGADLNVGIFRYRDRDAAVDRLGLDVLTPVQLGEVRIDGAVNR